MLHLSRLRLDIPPFVLYLRAMNIVSCDCSAASSLAKGIEHHSCSSFAEHCDQEGDSYVVVRKLTISFVVGIGG